MEQTGELKTGQADESMQNKVLKGLEASAELQSSLNPSIESLNVAFRSYKDKLDQLNIQIQKNLDKMSPEEMQQIRQEMRTLAVDLHQEMVAADNLFDEFFRKINLIGK
jgi:hypothetical protein